MHAANDEGGVVGPHAIAQYGPTRRTYADPSEYPLPSGAQINACGIMYCGGPQGIAYQQHACGQTTATNVALTAAVTAIPDHANLKHEATRFFTEWLAFHGYSNGVGHDQCWWHDAGNPHTGLGDEGTMIGRMITSRHVHYV